MVGAVGGADAAHEAKVLQAVAPGVVRTLRSILGSGHGDLDDAVQESLLALVAALPKFRQECSLQRFANRIAVRIGLRFRRSHRAAAVQAPAVIDEVASEALCPEAATQATRRLALLHQLLDDLPEPQAEVLALRVLAGLSLGETAEMTGAPVNTVRSRLRLARLALRTRIEVDPGLMELLEADR